MERYAQVIGGVVDNVIESEKDPDGTNGGWIVCGNAGPGWKHNSDGTFSPPATQDAAPRNIAVGSFFDRFGTNKWEILSSDDAAVKALVLDCSVRTKVGINLSNPDVARGVQLLQAKGFAVSAELVIDAPILESEKP